MAQLLINDAESAIAEANPAGEGFHGNQHEVVTSGVTTSPSQQVTHSQMRTAAAVWAGRKEAWGAPCRVLTLIASEGGTNMAVAGYVTKKELEDALKPIKADMKAMEKRLESRIYTGRGDILLHMDSMEKRILAEIRNGR